MVVEIIWTGALFAFTGTFKKGASKTREGSDATQH